MLDVAYKHEKEIRNKMMDTWYDEKYKFYYCSGYHEPLELSKDGDWNSRQFASIDTEGNILGLIGYRIDRQTMIANGFGAINFSNNILTFGYDLGKVIEDIFLKFNMRKLEFGVVVGNPIEKQYDKLIEKYHGRIVGTRKEHCCLMDNKLYDEKLYELFREDYIKARGK